jgi:hypothetical protein
VKPDESLDAFQRRVGGADSVSRLSVAEGLSAMFRFFAEVPAEQCADTDGDTLLFQWGTYDWGRGEQFEINITRQFRRGAGEEDEIAQLGLTFTLSPDADLRSLGQDAKWCKSRAALAEFERCALASAPCRTVEARRISRTELKYEYV